MEEAWARSTRLCKVCRVSQDTFIEEGSEDNHQGKDLRRTDGMNIPRKTSEFVESSRLSHGLTTGPMLRPCSKKKLTCSGPLCKDSRLGVTYTFPALHLFETAMQPSVDLQSLFGLILAGCDDCRRTSSAGSMRILHVYNLRSSWA